MARPTQEDFYYQALIDKDPSYEGVFYVGVATTGVFCRPTCDARKPKRENCVFFKTAREALASSFRPCKRCQPLSHPREVSLLVQTLVQAVEANPEKRWKDADFATLSVDAVTARRQFKKRFGMTFVAYARLRRMGLALSQIRDKKEDIIQVQLNAGYASSSGFRDAFSKIMGAPPSKTKDQYKMIKAKWMDTPLGPMVAMADETGLYLLEFTQRRGLEREVERLRIRLGAAIVPGTCEVLEGLGVELAEYFAGTRKTFEIPLHLGGTPFQRTVWKELMRIPYGQTISYEQEAVALEKPTAFRAVANANGANQIAILIPCHRVIQKNGNLGGYGGGVACKEALLELERLHR